METGISLHFNYKKYDMRALALCFFYVQIQPTVYKVKLCFINPPEEQNSSAF